MTLTAAVIMLVATIVGATVTLLVAIGAAWSDIKRDVARLGERVARIEGMLEMYRIVSVSKEPHTTHD